MCREALLRHFEDMKKQAHESGGRLNMVSIQPFRTFGWMLDAASVKLVNSWVNQSVVSQPIIFKTIQDKEGTPQKGSSSDAVIVPVASSFAPPEPKKITSKGSKKKPPNASSEELGMMKIFKRKSAA